jgi:hypothetical protein
MTLRIATMRKIILSITTPIEMTQHSYTYQNNILLPTFATFTIMLSVFILCDMILFCHYAESFALVLSAIMLRVIMLRVIILNELVLIAIMLSIVMLSVIMLRAIMLEFLYDGHLS